MQVTQIWYEKKSDLSDVQLWQHFDFIAAFPVSVQNGSLHQKDTVHDNDFEPYLTGQSNQVPKLK